jgi:hypothetical protein
MARKGLIGILAVLLIWLIAGAGYRCGKQLAETTRHGITAMPRAIS